MLLRTPMWMGGLTVLAVALVGLGCAGDRHHGEEMPFGPGGMNAGVPAGPTLMSVSPTGGATGVSVGAAMVLRFSHPMGTVGQPFVDLHQGDLGGPVVQMTFTWSSDGRTLNCQPDAPLRSRTSYTLHVGGGMLDAQGRVVDMEHYGPAWGGHWIDGGMMSGPHGGTPWPMLGDGWHHSGVGYGMAFPFTTG